MPESRAMKVTTGYVCEASMEALFGDEEPVVLGELAPPVPVTAPVGPEAPEGPEPPEPPAAPVAVGMLADPPLLLGVSPRLASATPLEMVGVGEQLLEEGVMNGAEGVTVSPTV